MPLELEQRRPLAPQHINGVEQGRFVGAVRSDECETQPDGIVRVQSRSAQTQPSRLPSPLASSAAALMPPA
jgi:hypothetical protein